MHNLMFQLTAAMMWIERRMGSGDDPRSILKNMSVDEKEIPGDLDDAALWKLIASCVAEPPRRSKLEGVSTYEDVVELVKKSSKIVVLTGAGVSDSILCFISIVLTCCRVL